MELTTVEVTNVEVAAREAAEDQARQLGELHLVFAGGGMCDVVAG
jgi:hypothetical protein